MKIFFLFQVINSLYLTKIYMGKQDFFSVNQVVIAFLIIRLFILIWTQTPLVI